jgi:hypothetical protein
MEDRKATDWLVLIMQTNDSATEVKPYPRVDMMDEGLILLTIPPITIELTNSQTPKIKAAGNNEKNIVNIRRIKTRNMHNEPFHHRALRTKHK